MYRKHCLENLPVKFKAQKLGLNRYSFFCFVLEKDKRFADEAIAGLSSTEDLAAASTALRKTAKDSSGVSKEIKDFGGFLPVMLLQIKGRYSMQGS